MEKLLILVLILSLTSGLVVVVPDGKIPYAELQDIVKSHMKTELESKFMEFIPNREKNWMVVPNPPEYSMKRRPRMRK